MNRRRRRTPRRYQRRIHVISIITTLPATTVAAQIATDGTVGPAASLQGPNYQIPAQLG